MPVALPGFYALSSDKFVSCVPAAACPGFSLVDVSGAADSLLSIFFSADSTHGNGTSNVRPDPAPPPIVSNHPVYVFAGFDTHVYVNRFLCVVWRVTIRIFPPRHPSLSWQRLCVRCVLLSCMDPLPPPPPLTLMAGHPGEQHHLLRPPAGSLPSTERFHAVQRWVHRQRVLPLRRGLLPI